MMLPFTITHHIVSSSELQLALVLFQKLVLLLPKVVHDDARIAGIEIHHLFRRAPLWPIRIPRIDVGIECTNEK